jgi:hypothetical protein
LTNLALTTYIKGTVSNFLLERMAVTYMNEVIVQKCVDKHDQNLRATIPVLVDMYKTVLLSVSVR